MRIIKKFILTFFVILFPIVCFSNTIDKPYLVFKVNSESLVIDNTNIKGAKMAENDDGTYSLSIVLMPSAAEQFTKITAANIGKKMSLFYGSDKLISQATIQSALGSELLIANFPEKEGKALIDSLKNNQLQ